MDTRVPPFCGFLICFLVEYSGSYFSHERTLSIKSNHKSANTFMLFLLSYNSLLIFAIASLYWNFWHGTDSFAAGLINSHWFLPVGQLLGFLLPMAVFGSLLRGVEEREGIAPTPIKKKPLGLINIVLIIAISLIIQPLVMLVSGLTSLFFPNPASALLSDLVALPIPLALAILALTPAICEELVFRGFIQARYEAQPMVYTALVNGLFFGIIHLNLHQFGYAFLMGIVFAYMVYFTQSIYSAILSHFVINASQFFLAYLNAAQLYGSPERAELWEAIVELGRLSLFILPLIVLLFYLFVWHNRQKNPVSETAIETAIETAKPPHPFDISFWAVLLLYVLLALFVL